MTRYNVIVVGLGAMGSAATYQLAKRGARVLGIDRFSPPHDLGSSHGDTRITRLAIGEGAHYTPLVKRSHEIWRDIERETGADLLTQCGELIISSKGERAFTHVEGFFANTVAAARAHGIAHELLDAPQIRARYPAFNVRDDEFGYFEPEAGFVRPEVCIAAQLQLAETHGAEIRQNEIVTGFEAAAHGVSIQTDRGSYSADKLLVAAGTWLPGLVGDDLAKLLRVHRQVLCWFEVDGDIVDHEPPRFPVFIWELADTQQGIYGFPSIDGMSLKVSTEEYAYTTSPDAVDRTVSEEEISATHRQFVAPFIKGVSARASKTKVCLYTVTPDAGFIIDYLPSSERVILASCCSGHGFKHSAAIGEVLADMAQGRESPFELAACRLGRFS